MLKPPWLRHAIDKQACLVLLPENAHAYTWTHVEPFRVLEIRKERLYEMAFFHRYDYNSRFNVGGGKSLEIVEGCPVTCLWFVGTVIPREWPGVGRGKGDGEEGSW